MSPIDRSIIAACKPVEPPADPKGLPYPTHSGILNLGGIELRVHRLSTGQAIIEEESMKKFLEALGMTGDDVIDMGFGGQK